MHSDVFLCGRYPKWLPIWPPFWHNIVRTLNVFHKYCNIDNLLYELNSLTVVIWTFQPLYSFFFHILWYQSSHACNSTKMAYYQCVCQDGCHIVKILKFTKYKTIECNSIGLETNLLVQNIITRVIKVAPYSHEFLSEILEIFHNDCYTYPNENKTNKKYG